MGTEGTHTILDIDGVVATDDPSARSGIADYGTLRPLALSRVVHHVGTDRPSVAPRARPPSSRETWPTSCGCSRAATAPSKRSPPSLTHTSLTGVRAPTRSVPSSPNSSPPTADARLPTCSNWPPKSSLTSRTRLASCVAEYLPPSTVDAKVRTHSRALRCARRTPRLVRVEACASSSVGEGPGRYAGGRGWARRSGPAGAVVPVVAQRWPSRNSRTSAVVMGPVPCATASPSFSRT